MKKGSSERLSHFKVILVASGRAGIWIWLGQTSKITLAPILCTVSQAPNLSSICNSFTLWFLIGFTIKQNFTRLYIFQSYRCLANFKYVHQPLLQNKKRCQNTWRQVRSRQVPHRKNTAGSAGVILDAARSSLWNGEIRMDLGCTCKEWDPLERSLLGSPVMENSLLELFKNELSKLFRGKSHTDRGWIRYLNSSF